MTRTKSTRNDKALGCGFYGEKPTPKTVTAHMVNAKLLNSRIGAKVVISVNHCMSKQFSLKSFRSINGLNR